MAVIFVMAVIRHADIVLLQRKIHLWVHQMPNEKSVATNRRGISSVSEEIPLPTLLLCRKVNGLNFVDKAKVLGVLIIYQTHCS